MRGYNGVIWGMYIYMHISIKQALSQISGLQDWLTDMEPGWHSELLNITLCPIASRRNGSFPK